MPNMNAPVIPPPILPGSTHIVRLQEAVTMEELSNDEEYNDIMEDMQEECAKVNLEWLCSCTGPFDILGVILARSAQVVYAVVNRCGFWEQF